MESRSIAYRPAYYREVVERVREKARRTIEHYLAGYYKCLRKDDYSHADTLKKVEARRAEKWAKWEADRRRQGDERKDRQRWAEKERTRKKALLVEEIRLKLREDMRKELETEDRRIKTLEREVEQLKARKDRDDSALPLDLLEEEDREDELDRRLSAEKETYSRSVDEHRGVKSVIVRLTKH